MEHNPRAVIIKHRIKETPDSVTYKVVTYKIDSTYQETLPKKKVKNLGRNVKNHDKTLKKLGETKKFLPFYFAVCEKISNFVP